jgi:phenylacetate-coenzyme A ligase PaaK-like adenylate-forming protein
VDLQEITNVPLLVSVLRARHHLRQRDHWTRSHLEAYQTRALRRLRDDAYARSPFYRQIHRGLTDRPLHELPVLTKALLMEHFDDLVTDRSVRLADVQAYLSALHGNERFQQRYWVSATSGSTGRRGLFLWNRAEWTMVITSYNQAFDWGGSRAGVRHRTKAAIVSTTTPWHQSARVGASVHSPWVPTLRLDAGDPLERIVARLTRWQPELVVAYASMVRLLAEEQLAGRLMIAPRYILSASEVLTAATRRRVAAAWGQKVFNVYGATEGAGLAAECERHSGLHLFEDLVLTEVVDAHNRPLPPGVYGEKVLITVLFSRTQPLTATR